MCGTVPCPILQGVFASRHSIRIVVGRKHAFKIGHNAAQQDADHPFAFVFVRLSQSDLRTYGRVSTLSLPRRGVALIPLEPESGIDSSASVVVVICFRVHVRRIPPSDMHMSKRSDVRVASHQVYS